MYKVKTGNMITICISSGELLEELLKKDVKFPCRGDMSMWTEYRELKDLGYGPFTV